MAIRQSKLADVEYVSVKAETDLAYLFVFPGEDKEAWIPKSMCDVDEDGKIITMPEWMAVEKKLV